MAATKCLFTTGTEFQLTRPLRGVALAGLQLIPFFQISTHTPLAGRDRAADLRHGWTDEFQLTRPLRGVTDLGISRQMQLIFQLTRPLRGVTNFCASSVYRLVFQLTRPLRGVTA